MKISAFLFVFLFATVLTSALATRPTQAESLFPIGCWLNIGKCETGDDAATGTPEAAKPGDGATGNEGGTNTGGGSNAGTGGETTMPEEGTDPGAGDTQKPTVGVGVNRTLAGGTAAQDFSITGSVQDEHLASYTLAVTSLTDTTKPAATIRTENAFADPSATIGIDELWKVTAPNKVPSGEYMITLDAVDANGNTGHAETQVQVDNDAPVVTIKGGGLIQSGSIAPTVTAADSEGSGVTGYSWAADADANPAVIVFDRNAMEPTFTPKTEGTYVFNLTVQDGLGNTVTKPFTFDYAPILATIPLPTIQDPTLNFVKPSEDETQTNVTPTIRGDQDQSTDENASVLSNTIAAARQVSPGTAASALTPTNSGWSIFGILWYWWAVVAGILVTAWYFIKKFFDVQLAEQS